MSRLQIITAPDPRLKQTAAPVPEVNRSIRGVFDDMLVAMHEANGIGLAAPQVGILKRLIIVDISQPNAPSDPVFLANPEIVWRSNECVNGEEGCLSLPEQYADVTRSKQVRVRFVDRDNVAREIDAEGLLARCIQHEIDHLDGTLFVDHISSLKRNMILRKLAKAKKLKAAS